MVRMHRSVLALALLALSASALLAQPSPVAAQSVAACTSVSATAFAYALRGTVYRSRPSGGGRCRLTAAVGAKEPQLAPGGRRVAFLTGTGTFGTGNRAINTVRIARVGGLASTGFVVRGDRQLHGALDWSPTGKRLAFRDGSDLWVWGTGCGCARRILPGTQHTPSEQSFAWSPDGTTIAAARLPTQIRPTRQLQIEVVNAATAQRHTITITLPRWVEGAKPYSGSYPSRILGWERGGRLLIGTSGWGIGVSLTSVWDAPASGGPARLLIGTKARGGGIGLRSPLLNSTSGFLSPGGIGIALDPYNHLWVGSPPGAVGHTLNLGIHGSCALAQIVWINETRLAYVTVCTVPSNHSIPILARLYTVGTAGGKPREIDAVRSRRQDTLSIAPPVRCIACGAG